MKAGEFLRALGRKDPDPVYFFSGGERFLKIRAVEKLKNAIPEGQRPFNVDVWRGGEAGMADVLSTARTFPFLSGRRLVVCLDVEKMKGADACADLLGAYLEDPSPETILVFSTEEANASRSWSRRYKGKWTEVDFRALKGASLSSAFREAAAERGLKFDPEAAALLLEEVGNDLGRISLELDKVAAYPDRGKTVTADDVHLLISGYSYRTMFDLVQAICDRDLPAALDLVDGVFPTGAEVPGLVGMLAKRFRTLWYLAGERGGEGVPPVFRVQGWQLKDLKRQASAFSRGELERLLGMLLDMDRLIKSAPLSPRLLLERLILTLGQGGEDAGRT